MANQLVWTDIPVTDLDRAMKFYESVLGAPIKKQEYPGFSIGLLPGEESDVTGCLYVSKEDRPSAQGPLLYFGCNGRLDEAVAAVTPGGGKVLQPKHPIGPHGFRAVVLDSEGNRIALHSD